MFRELRRKDRKMAENDAIALLFRAPYGVLSTSGSDGYAYGVPLSYVYLDGHIYFHCATEGHKLDNIKNNDKVSFCVVGDVENAPEQFTAKYESVILFGRISEVQGDEKQAAFLALVEKYAAEFREKGKEYICNAEGKAKIMKISVEHIAGKANR